jgi:hypothetical protein
MKKFKKNITKKKKLKNKRNRIHRKTIKNYDGGFSVPHVAALGLGLFSGSKALTPNSRGLKPFQPSNVQPSELQNIQHSSSVESSPKSALGTRLVSPTSGSGIPSNLIFFP